MKEKYTKILEKLTEIEILFQNNQGIILSEDDLKCLLFYKLYDLYDHCLPTFNNEIKGSPLHSELKFFDEQGKLFFRPDILILNPENYSIKHSISDFKISQNRIIYKSTSSKEFEFGGDVIIIELKFCKSKGGIKTITSFAKDLDKIKKIKLLVEKNSQSKVLGLLAIFNKTDKTSNQFEQFISSSHFENDEVQAKYYSGMVMF